MSKVLRLVNGIPRMQTQDSVSQIYDQVYTPPSTITSGTAVSLPMSMTYDSAELEIFLNGQRLDVATDYSYVGSGTAKTQVSFSFDLYVTDKITFRIANAIAESVEDQSLTNSLIFGG